MTVSTGVSRCSNTFRLKLMETSIMYQYAWITVILGLKHARMITPVLRIICRSWTLLLHSLTVQLHTPVVHFVRCMETARDSVTQYGGLFIATLLMQTTVL